MEVYSVEVEKIKEPIIIGKIELADVLAKAIKAKVCCYCGNKLFKKELITKDHLIPKCRGGNGTKNNLKPCCSNCNICKGSKYPEEFLIHFIKHYKTKRDTIKPRFQHVKDFDLMVKNIIYIIQFVRSKGKALFFDKGEYETYLELRKPYNKLINNNYKAL